MKEILEWYYQQGFNLIPVPIGRKSTVVTWKQFQEKQAPQIPDTYRGNIVVILGKTSGNLVDVDCDTMELLDLMVKILPETLTTKSHRGGHLYFRTDYTIRKFILDLGEHGKLEVAGQGQISILPPSIHEKGTVYEFINQKEPMTWHGDFKQELRQLLEKEFNIKIKREAINIKKLLKGVGYGERDQSAIIVATWYRKQSLNKEEVTEKMLEWNQKLNPPYGQHPTDTMAAEHWVEIKVESAFRPEKPYHYHFLQPKKEKKCSCGEVLEDKVFEQINGEFLVYDKGTREITRKKIVEGFEPLKQIPWKPIDDVLPYESEQKICIEKLAHERVV